MTKFRKKDGTYLEPMVTPKLIQELNNKPFDVEDVDLRKKVELYKQKQKESEQLKEKLKTERLEMLSSLGINEDISLEELQQRKLDQLSKIASKL